MDLHIMILFCFSSKTSKHGLCPSSKLDLAPVTPQPLRGIKTTSLQPSSGKRERNGLQNNMIYNTIGRGSRTNTIIVFGDSGTTYKNIFNNIPIC